MVRPASAALLCLALCGCAHSRFVEHPITSWFTTAPAVKPAPASETADAHCQRVARQRRRDASFAGEDEATQRQVYDRSYAQCTAWDASHGMH